MHYIQMVWPYSKEKGQSNFAPGTNGTSGTDGTLPSNL